MKSALWAFTAAMLLSPLTSFGNDYFPSQPETYVQAVQSVDVSKYASTEMEIKQALFKVLYLKGWTITGHTRYKVTAQYKDTTMVVSINGYTIEFREVSPGHKSDYGWISSAANNFMLDIQYYYQVRLAEQMMSGEGTK